MGKYLVFAFVLTIACGVRASWYWPFGSDDEAEGKKPPRLSELMEPASLLIDEASDLAGDGKTDESVEKYRKALAELDRIEQENPDRVKAPEFASLRNKRAYVNAAIDSMLLSQIQDNAKSVAVSDTTELEKKLAEERKAKSVSGAAVTAPVAETATVRSGVEKKSKAGVEVEQRTDKDSAVRLKLSTSANKPKTKREQAMVDIANGDFAAADILIKEMLAAKPNGVMALNLKATMESRQGKFKEAERTLDQAIRSNPRNYFAYYNMAILMLQVNPDNKDVPRRYYETGRSVGGPKDEQLEALIK